MLTRCGNARILAIIFALLIPKYALSLEFNARGSFKIVIFTDLHQGEGDEKDSQNSLLQRNVIDRESPDLIIYLGDMVSGWIGGSKSNWFHDRWKDVTGYAHSKGIPYAFTLGNHDDEADLSRLEIVKLASKLGGNLSVTKVGPENVRGVTNYWVNIHKHGSQDIAARLWFFDSMNYGCADSEASWGCIGYDGVKWLKEESSNIPNVPMSLAFVHIPLPDLRLAYGDPFVVGTRQEDSACPTVSTGFLKQAADSNIGAIFSGHDHQNDFLGNVHFPSFGNGSNVQSGFGSPTEATILMGYGRKSGFGSYGPGKLTNGARVLELWDVSNTNAVVQTRSFYISSPQQFLYSPLALMDTWITNYQGAREFQRTPTIKARVQEACSSSKLFYGQPILLSIFISVLSVCFS
jgi:pre-mRNA-splicing factor SYF1